jgi:hypothetical protein
LSLIFFSIQSDNVILTDFNRRKGDCKEKIQSAVGEEWENHNIWWKNGGTAGRNADGFLRALGIKAMPPKRGDISRFYRPLFQRTFPSSGALPKDGWFVPDSRGVGGHLVGEDNLFEALQTSIIPQ